VRFNVITANGRGDTYYSNEREHKKVNKANEGDCCRNGNVERLDVHQREVHGLKHKLWRA
jgi:hypothetical protein